MVQAIESKTNEQKAKRKPTSGWAYACTGAAIVLTTLGAGHFGIPAYTQHRRQKAKQSAAEKQAVCQEVLSYAVPDTTNDGKVVFCVNSVQMSQDQHRKNPFGKSRKLDAAIWVFMRENAKHVEVGDHKHEEIKYELLADCFDGTSGEALTNSNFIARVASLD